MIDPREQGWLKQAEDAAGTGTPTDQLIRLMHWIGQKLVSKNPPPKTKNPVEILELGHGWCDQQALVFIWCVSKLYGFETRQIAIYHTDGVSGHTVAEVFYEDKWRLFDVHSEHQAVYLHPETGEVMGYLEICAHVEQVIAENHWWRGQNGQGKDGFYAVAALYPWQLKKNNPGAAYCDFRTGD